MSAPIQIRVVAEGEGDQYRSVLRLQSEGGDEKLRVDLGVVFRTYREAQQYALTHVQAVLEGPSVPLAHPTIG